MFITRLYKHNKLLCAGFLLFAALQLFINIKRGITATPFLHYGMYSGFVPRPSKLTIWEVDADRQRIDLLKLPPKVADCIIEPLRLHDQLGETNNLYYTHIQRFLAPLPRLDSSHFISRLTKADFDQWYKNNLSKIIGRDIKELIVSRCEYEVKNSGLSFVQKSLYIHDNN
ncbi:MAG TPA: hypothetical protein VM935_14915 [Chitinophagaceae bacterium]|nr:hypothetical protein [Chitinophagaceae bacterium]